jgi:hypothetical protein
LADWSQARELGLLQLDTFYRSKQFGENHFALDSRRRVISKTFNASADAPAA